MSAEGPVTVADASRGSGFIRTVLGDVSPHRLGRVNYHEHLFQVSPLLPGDELDDEQRSGAELDLLRDSGFDAMVDATPIGLGRRPAALARLSRTSRVAVVATTGLHRDGHYSDQPWIHELTSEQWASVFIRELTIGQASSDDKYRLLISDPDAGSDAALQDVAYATTPTGAPVRAGLLKAGIDYWSITPTEREVLLGVAAAHIATGAPVMVHTEACSAALEVIELLADAGVQPSRVVIAHADRVTDPYLHAEIASTGALVGYDGAGRLRAAPDRALIDSLADLVERGHGGNVLLGADVARASRYAAYGGMPGLAYLGTRFIPRVLATIGHDALHRILVDNPSRFLTWSRVSDRECGEARNPHRG